MDEDSVIVKQFINAFGMVVQGIRLERSLTFEELATICDISTIYMREIVNGNVNPSVRILVKIAIGLDVTLSELIAKAEQEMKRR